MKRRCLSKQRFICYTTGDNHKGETPFQQHSRLQGSRMHGFCNLPIASALHRVDAWASPVANHYCIPNSQPVPHTQQLVHHSVVSTTGCRSMRNKIDLSKHHTKCICLVECRGHQTLSSQQHCSQSDAAQPRRQFTTAAQSNIIRQRSTARRAAQQQQPYHEQPAGLEQDAAVKVQPTVTEARPPSPAAEICKLQLQSRGCSPVSSSINIAAPESSTTEQAGNEHPMQNELIQSCDDGAASRLVISGPYVHSVSCCCCIKLHW